MRNILKALLVAYAELSRQFQKDPMKCKAYADAMEVLK
jgi:hypothetical protein